MGHASPFELYYSARPADMVKAERPVPPVACNEGPRSRFPTNIAFDAILQNLDRWAAHRHRAAARELIQRVNNTTVVDEHGNVVGRRALAVRRRADQHVVRVGDRPRRSASSRATSGRSRRRSSRSSIRARRTMWPRSTRACAPSWPQRFITEEDGRFIMQEARYACTLGPANDPFQPRCWDDTDGTVGGTVPATLSPDTRRSGELRPHSRPASRASTRPPPRPP